ncbi:hypothetical protein [Yersinia enterocolitica]|uniref:hypothetical protein n=1 Tax=Yersinia enterocolitica TaxID=630 RepID=UPI003CFC2593
MSENTDYETLKVERDSALNTCTLIGEALGIKGAFAGDTIAKVHQLVGENAVLTDKAASELSNAWLLHKYWVGIQAALMHMHVGRINEATEWLIGTVSGPGIEAPNLKLTDEIEDWAEIQQKDTISHAQALEIIKAEMSASTQALNEIKARGVDEFADNWQRKESHSQISEMARRFAASLRSNS